MKHFMTILFLLLTTRIYGSSLIFIYVGKELPAYAYTALEQARLFNPTCALYCLVSQPMREPFVQKHSIKQILVHTLSKTKEHHDFLQATAFTDGLWRYSSERFLYLYDVMVQYNLTDIVHLEADVMLYVDIAELEPIFKKYYKGIAAVFDNDDRCIPGFVYIAHAQAAQKLARCFVSSAAKKMSDMYTFGILKNINKHNDVIGMLPIMIPEYHQLYGLRSQKGHTTATPAAYSQHSHEFNAIFDAAALGQYLGGIDGNYHAHGGVPGFINESCLFDPSNCQLTWQQDARGRRIPYVTVDKHTVRINNLHIHAKSLEKFAS